MPCWKAIDDEVAAMATISALIHNSLGHLWTGFYRVAVPGTRLIVGPVSGNARMSWRSISDSGVCGTAAAEERTVIVDDVLAFPGHITCDARSRSEIVVPVFNADGDLDRRSRYRFRPAVGVFGRRSCRISSELVAWFRMRAK